MIRKRIWWGIFPLLVVLTGWGSQAYAACVKPFIPARISSVVVNFGEVTVNNNLPNGSVVYNGEVSLNPVPNRLLVTAGDCRGGSYAAEKQVAWTITQNNSPEGGGVILKTNVPGISLRLYSSAFNPIGSTTLNNVDRNYSYAPYAKLEYQLIKTGKVVSGSLTSGLWMSTKITPLPATGSPFNVSMLSGASVNRITAFTPTCSVNTTNIDVPLGSTPAGDFSGIGSTPRTKNFNLGLWCDDGVNMIMTLNATQSAETTDKSVIALNGNDAAKGVGIQVLYNNNLVRLGQPLSLGASHYGVNDIPFTARYIQTQSKITGGSASATATFTMTYQ